MTTGILVAGAAFGSTTLGGLAAIRVRDRLHLLLGFSAGAVMGVALFDVFPELISRIEEAHLNPSRVMLFVALGFLNFFILERLTALHGSAGHEHQHGREHNPEMGMVAAAGLSVHSFLDGVAIAVGFRTTLALGIAIDIAVLAHDFSDGLNTVTVVLAHGNRLRRAVAWLLADAITPVLGATVATILPLPNGVLPYILAVFVGFFIYIGAADLLPEAREHDSLWPAVAVVGGMAALFTITRFI
ncbi:MAG: zinc transporter ZupT [Candidatus Dormibacteria bacterium]